jgi:hypothetical protein
MNLRVPEKMNLPTTDARTSERTGEISAARVLAAETVDILCPFISAGDSTQLPSSVTESSGA